MITEHQIRTLQGADFDPDPEIRYPGLAILACTLAAWAILGGIAYAIHYFAS